MANILYLRLGQATLFDLYLQSICCNKLQNLLDMVQGLFYCTGENTQIVQIDSKKLDHLQAFIHKYLDACSRVHEAKQHHLKLEGPVTTHKRFHLLAIFMRPYMPISNEKFEQRIVFYYRLVIKDILYQ